MRRTLLAGCVLLATAAANAADFDIDAYCHMVTKEAADRDAAEETCRAQEKRDQRVLDELDFPDSIARHCNEVALGVGGSYRAMLTCVRQELVNQKLGN